MKVILVFILAILSILLSHEPRHTPISLVDSLVLKAVNGCRADNDLTRENMVLFISHPRWKDNRIATGTDGLDPSQLKLLTDDQDLAACQHFNTEHNAAINQTHSEAEGGGPNYHIVYYKAGSFYFVSTVLAQPLNPEYHSVGLSFIEVYDNSLNRIKGYSF